MAIDQMELLAGVCVCLYNVWGQEGLYVRRQGDYAQCPRLSLSICSARTGSLTEPGVHCGFARLARQ